jgi:hypothetical protein
MNEVFIINISFHEVLLLNTNLGRMELEVHALRKEASATQRSIQQWRADDSAGPYAVVSVLPSLPPLSRIDTAMLDATAVVVVALLLWTAAARRLRTSPVVRPEQAPARPQVPVAPVQPAAPAPRAAVQPAATAAVEPIVRLVVAPEVRPAFDSEAAASEVIRVRKSLAGKREARGQPGDIDLQLDLDPSPEPAAEAVEPRPVMPAYDYTVTLALAEESANQTLWPEARELATEVLEAGSPALRAQASALLERIELRKRH